MSASMSAFCRYLTEYNVRILVNTRKAREPFNYGSRTFLFIYNIPRFAHYITPRPTVKKSRSTEFDRAIYTFALTSAKISRFHS